MTTEVRHPFQLVLHTPTGPDVKEYHVNMVNLEVEANNKFFCKIGSKRRYRPCRCPSCKPSNP